jgi:outer membrane protein OmpA-like peptidoglycan-associated protein
MRRNGSRNITVAAALLAAIAMLQAGCASGPMTAREHGALGGAAVGATSGAIIGGASGDAAEGALIGGAVGAITGAIVGDSIEAQRQREARDAALAEQLQRQNFEARTSDRGVVVNLPDVLFEFGRAELTSQAYRKVASISAVLNSQGVQWRSVSIEGHTDAIGSDESNQRLSERRAQSVADALVQQRVDPARLVVQGFGEAYPRAANVHGDGSDNPAGRARNRRVEVVILNEENAGPGSEPYPQPAYGEQPYPEQPQQPYPGQPGPQPTYRQPYPQQPGQPYPQQPAPPPYRTGPYYGPPGGPGRAPGYPPPRPPYGY